MSIKVKTSYHKGSKSASCFTARTLVCEKRKNNNNAIFYLWLKSNASQLEKNIAHIVK